MVRLPRRLRRLSGGALGGVALGAVVAACGPSASPAIEGSLPVPFNVSDYFAPTGYEGDGADVEDVTLVTMVNDACPTRSPTPAGDCYSVVYQDGAVDATQGFAAVLWQYPNNNFGEYPGHTVQPGATVVTGWVRGAAGGEQVAFQVGGTSDPSLPYQDSISVTSSPMTLTTDWQPFSISLPASYGEVLSAFGWVVKAPVPGSTGSATPPPIAFYLDGIQWQT
jgi:hypothetical protein